MPPATTHLEDPALVEMARRQFSETRVRGVSAILNRVPDEGTEAYVRGKLEALAGPPVLGVLTEDRTLQTQWLRCDKVEASGLQDEIRSIVLALEGQVAPATLVG